MSLSKLSYIKIVVYVMFGLFAVTSVVLFKIAGLGPLPVSIFYVVLAFVWLFSGIFNAMVFSFVLAPRYLNKWFPNCESASVNM